MKKNTIYTTGFVNDDGCIEIPGVFLEDGIEVELAITAMPNRFEVAMFPSEMPKHIADCGISEEEIENCCKQNEDCGTCPMNDYCTEEFAE